MPIGGVWGNAEVKSSMATILAVKRQKKSQPLFDACTKDATIINYPSLPIP
jgi:hypothetical protein